jgi:hypothetical protein
MGLLAGAIEIAANRREDDRWGKGGVRFEALAQHNAAGMGWFFIATVYPSSCQ